MTSMTEPSGESLGRPTLREVAALAGVSIKTVSRVVNDEAGVSEAAVRRVRVAVERLGYRQDLAASSLRRSVRKTRSIGLILDDIGNPYSAALHRSIEQLASPRGVVILAGSSNHDPQRERDLVAAFAARRVDGLIIVPASSDHGYLSAERRAGTAVVFVDRPSSHFDADAVLAGDADGSHAAVSHLHSFGHRRIACIADDARLSTAQLRVRGYRSALDRHGLTFENQLVVMDVSDSDLAFQAATRLLDRSDPPTAIFAAQNLITIGTTRALRALGLHRSVALVGFDDFLLADLLDPAVTVVAQDMQGIGRAAAELLFSRIDGDPTQTRTVVVPTELIVRGSGEIPSPNGPT